MKYNLSTLKNGLRLITIPLPVKSVTVEVSVDAGSRYETEKNNGISHFLEHMFFKGTKKRATALALSSEVDSFGGEMNAGTGKEGTAFYIKAAGEHLEKVLDILSDILWHSKFEEAEIKKEKGVIIEEINMRNDIPMQKVGEIFDTLLYSPTPIGNDIIGTKETIEKMQRKDFLNYLKERYRPERMVVGIAGNTEPKAESRKLKALIEKYFGNGCHSGGRRPIESSEAATKVGEAFTEDVVTSSTRSYLRLRRIQDDTIKNQGALVTAGLQDDKSGQRKTYVFVQGKPQVLMEYKKTEQAHFCLGVRTFERTHQDRYVLAVLAAILGGSMSSRLFEEIREKRGLAYYVRTTADHFHETGHLVSQAGVPINKISEAVKVILDEYRKVGKVSKVSKVSNEELLKAKEFLKGHLILSLEDSHSVGSLYGSSLLLEDRIITPEEMMKGIEKVTTEDLLRVAQKIFLQKNLNFAMIGPYKNESQFIKILEKF